ncbi:VOC family protein [Streptomyces sp. JJ66]|uniref:VOC family protein n=1 Tax=Streptomyces sp. JJ66 TaxID=2803843 RepID=UPI00214AF361|nr:hypothetical protein [Streptomyces sp. JJ66]
MPTFLVTDVAATAHAAREKDATVEQPPSSMPGGPVRARIRDPHGRRFGLLAPPAQPAAG